MLKAIPWDKVAIEVLMVELEHAGKVSQLLSREAVKINSQSLGDEQAGYASGPKSLGPINQPL